MDPKIFGGLVRHLLTIAAGSLLTKGVIDAGQIELVAGAITGILGVAWSIWQKKKA